LNEVTVVPMKRDVMKIPTLESGPKVTWTLENATKSTTTAHFNEATLTARKMAAIMYILTKSLGYTKKVMNSVNTLKKWAIPSQA